MFKQLFLMYFISGTVQHILKKQNYLISKIHGLEEKLATSLHPAENTSVEVIKIMEEFPLKNVNQIDEFDQFLKDEGNYKNFVCFYTLLYCLFLLF